MPGGALSQNCRDTIHESIGSGLPAAAAGRASEDNNTILDILLDPTDSKTEVELKRQLVLDVSAKVGVSKTVLLHADTITAKVSNDDAMTLFTALQKDIRGEQRKNQFLSPLFVKLARLLSSILKNSKCLTSLGTSIYDPLSRLKMAVNQATQAARTKHTGVFTAKVVTLCSTNAKHRFCKRTERPAGETLRPFLSCHHPDCTNWPNSNAKVITNNQRKTINRDTLAALENAAMTCEETVYTNQGTVFTKGRTRPLKLLPAVIVCHCHKMGCTLTRGMVGGFTRHVRYFLAYFLASWLFVFATLF
jgi:hypothetical protein